MNNVLEDVKIKYVKVRDVKSPAIAHKGDLGIDFFVPIIDSAMKQKILSNNPNIKFNNIHGVNCMELSPQQGVLIPSGIKVILPNDKGLDATNKSGIASKFNLLIGAELIDSDYLGEIFLNLINVGNTPVVINENQKLVQFIIVNNYNTILQEVEQDKYNELSIEKNSTRQDGGFSSTGI